MEGSIGIYLFDYEGNDEFVLVGRQTAVDNLQGTEKSPHIAEGHRNYGTVLVQEQVIEREEMILVIPLPHAVVKLFFPTHGSDLRAHMNLKLRWCNNNKQHYKSIN
jgi:hypothetical protein